MMEWPIALLWFALASLIKLTSRVEAEGSTHDGPAVYVNWHRYQTFLIPYHGGWKRWMMVSPAPQLAPVARFCLLSGLRLVRGTSGDRGKEALDELKTVLSNGDSVALAVDGPRGPAFRAKRGCVDLARAGGVPIIPIAYRSSRAYEFKWRWDHTLMPLPFAHIRVLCAPPITAAGSDDEVLAAVEAGLNSIDIRSTNDCAGA